MSKTAMSKTLKKQSAVFPAENQPEKNGLLGLIRPVKTEWWDAGVVMCLIWGEVQICIWPSRCHCH